MKLKVFAILTALFLFASALPAAAATVSINFDAGANGIDVIGTVPEAEKGGDDLLLLVEDEAGRGILSAVTKSVYKDGSVTYAFDKQIMSASLEGGNYKVTVSGRSFDAPVQTTFTYTNPIKVYDALKALYDNMADGKTATELWNAYNSNAEALGLDTTYSSVLKSDDGKATFAALLKTTERNLPADYTYSEEVAAEIAKVKAAARKAGGAAAFVEITDSTDFEAWYAEFYEELGYNDGTEEDDVTPLLISVKSKSEFATRIAAADGTLDLDEIKDILYESALLTVIETGTDTAVQKVFENYSSYFPGIDMDAYYDLSDLEKGKIIGAISGEKFDSLKDVSDKFDEQVEGEGDTTDDSSSKDKTSSKNSGGNVYLPVSSADTDETETKTFTDMSGTPWAEDAVYFLYERGIVNGRTESTYAPEAFVTRAEFVKMVMVAMGENDAQDLTKFKDVSPDAWYAPYVASAAEHGIVTGDENGNFNPEAQISREDMATILHRTIQGGKAVEAPEFSDSAEISDYAKTAVDFFAEQGVINGLGDGSFGPKKSATRAETAVMLYRLMKADK